MISGNTAQLSAALGRADKSVGGFANSVGSKMSGVGKAFGDVSKIAGGFVVAQGLMQLPGLFMGAAQAAADDAASVAKLQQAVENSGAAWSTYIGQMGTVIEQAQKRGFTDDQARDALSLLTAQTGDATEAQRRFALAQDLARGANIDVVTASKLLGKVTEDNVNVLGRYGIAAKEGMSETELFGMIQAKFGGQAETFAKSTAGQMAAAKIQMGELKESIGYAVLPVMTKLVDVVTTRLIPSIQKLAAEWLPRIQEGFAQAREKMQPFIDAVDGPLKTALAWLMDHKEILVAGLASVAAVIGGVLLTATIAWAAAMIAATWPIIAVVAAIALIGIAIYELVAHWDEIKAKTLEVWNGISDFLNEKFGFLKGLFEAAWTDMLAKVTFAWDSIQNYITTIIAVVHDIINIAMAVIHGDWGLAWDGIKQLVSDVWDGIKTQIDITIELIKGVFAGFPSYLLGLAGDFLSAAASLGSSIGSGIKDGIVSGISTIGEKAGEIGDALIGALKDAWNAAIQWADDNFALHIPGVSVKGVTLLPDIDFDPDFSGLKLARGGIVTRPTLALLGEGGPEAVIPLGGNQTSIARQGGFTNYGRVDIHLENPSPNFLEELERQLR